MSIIEKLFHIQQEAVSPKDQNNDFAKYKYRNIEGILRNVKPTFEKYKVYCQLSDEVVEVCGSAYVKATATLIDTETGELTNATGWAREMEAKKGNDSSQCTGSASTYARKYALCGLLGLDDSTAKAVIETDSESNEKHDEDMALSRQTILDQIYSFDMTRKELDQYIKRNKPNMDADTLPISDLKEIKSLLSQKWRNR